MAYTLSLHQSNGNVLARYTHTPHMPLRIAAQDHVVYQLLDENGAMPADLRSQRIGDDLWIALSDTQPLVIEDYFFYNNQNFNSMPVLSSHTVSAPEASLLPMPHLLAEEHVSASEAMPSSAAWLGLIGLAATGVALAARDDEHQADADASTDIAQPQTPYIPEQHLRLRPPPYRRQRQRRHQHQCQFPHRHLFPRLYQPRHLRQLPFLRRYQHPRQIPRRRA